MSNDLINRLRAYAAKYGRLDPEHQMCMEAVAEIERLRAAQQDGAAVGLMASEVACYKWPEDTDSHRAYRAAFIEGAQHAKMPENIHWRESLHGICSFDKIECSRCGPVEPNHVGWDGDYD